MKTFTRRTFGKRILSVGVLPLLLPQAEPQPDIKTTTLVPETIAGYRLNPEEKKLAENFCSTHEKNLAPLRQRPLPNSLAPYFTVASPVMGSDSGASK
jgi:hypothetical protein